MSIYLDHNATTPLDPRVLEAMLPYLCAQFGNPSSPHSLGRAARAAVERAREQVAALVNAAPAQIVFTSGGTEANNLALKGVLMTGAPARIAISAIEHASVRGPAQALAKSGWRLDEITVDAEGRATLSTIKGALRADTRLLALMFANNETGVIQDLAPVAALARRAGIFFHTDAIQALGKIKVDFALSGAHSMSLSAHKIYGPKGAGALVMDAAMPLVALQHGGGHEHSLRAGTENVAAIVGFGAAAELAGSALDANQRQLQALRDHLEQCLCEVPQAVIIAEHATRLPNTTLVSLPGFAGETLVLNLDRAGIMVATGSACNSGSLSGSAVLKAMGVAPRLMRNVLRISLGLTTTCAEIDIFIAELQRLHKQFQPWATVTPPV